jgi:hypothetical protein
VPGTSTVDTTGATYEISTPTERTPMTAYTKRKDRREYHVEMFDGRGTATVFIEDGYGRAVSDVKHVVAVHTEQEAIAAAVEEGLKEWA